jgi:hypothetical protein
MNTIWTTKGTYRRSGYKNEADLESVILQVQSTLFGANRVYLDVKKRIGAKGGVANIPDGYLIDLNASKPRLYVVENELAAHDPLRHIAVQILQFSLSFESEPRSVKTILFDALQDQPDARRQCEEYAAKHHFRNLDHLLESLVFETPFSALVIIDEVPDDLQNVLLRKFKFGVDVLELARYESKEGERLYHFKPFLGDVPVEDMKVLPLQDMDTVVVPAREGGFKETFLGENRWYAIRMDGTMIPQIKYIAVYRVSPISAITHRGPVGSIQPWKDSGKLVVNLAEPAHEIGPISLVKTGRVRAPQSLRYTNHKRLEIARTLDDVW